VHLSLWWILTCTALQIVSTTDLSPGLQNISFLSFIGVLTPEIRIQHLVLLFILLLVSLVGTVLAAMGVADTESGKPCGWWTLGCSGIGIVLLGTYALALIAKE
jgi:hypothetical protein